MKVVLMYHGERLSWNMKACQLFKDKKGGEHKFSGIKNLWFGRCYEMNGEKMKVRPEAVDGWEPTEKERDEYEAQKIVVRSHRQSRLEMMNIQKPHEKIVRAVELLRPFYLPMHNVDRRRFMEWVMNECSKKK